MQSDRVVRRERALFCAMGLWFTGLLLSCTHYPEEGVVVTILAMALCFVLMLLNGERGESMFRRQPVPGTQQTGKSMADSEGGDERDEGILITSATARRCTLLAAGTAITGDVVITGDCQVCGHITGSVILHEGVLRVMKGGRIDGDVQAPAVTLDGSLHGTCDADVVDILENGHLDGLCRSRQFSIVAGGVFTGQSERRAEPAVTDKDAGNGLSGTVTDLPSRRTRQVSPASAADMEKDVQADG